MNFKTMRSFGDLTLKYFAKEKVGHKIKPLDYLFGNSKKRLAKIAVLESERNLAFEHLQKLITELQTKRLRYNAKAACKYFTI